MRMKASYSLIPRKHPSASAEIASALFIAAAMISAAIIMLLPK